ncbi:hypothetical protein [Lonepinella koalarum]|uniref:hypothetical protein n=1 Tax=Lonepinella koalarum TaxID=53417 RepID=UPI003F6DB092
MVRSGFARWATLLSFTRYARTSCRWQSQRSKFYEFCACAKESRQRKAHPDFTTFLSLFGIFLTLNFELASLRQAKFS